MKIVLDIPDQKVAFMMELLHSLSFVKATPVSSEMSEQKAVFLSELGEAVKDLNEELAGKTTKFRDAHELLNEL